MALGRRQKLQTGAALLLAVILTAGAFFYGPTPGIFAAGVFSLCGVIYHDRRTRKLWELSVSYEMKKLNTSQDKMASQIKQATGEIAQLKEHITESPSAAAAALPDTGEVRLAVRAAAGTSPPRYNPRTAKEPDDNYSMPLAVRPGMKQPAKSQGRSYNDLASSQPDLSDNAVRAVVDDAIRNEQIDVFIQPIVRLPQRKVRFYEMFGRVRARPGLYLPAARYMRAVTDGSLMRDIDRLLLNECLEIVRETAHIDRAAPFFVNITSASLKNAPFMQKLLGFLGSHRHLAPRIVFEMTQSDFKKLKPGMIEILKGLGQLGCSFSIDNVTDMDFEIGALLRLRVRYVKISAADLVARANNPKDFAEMQKIKRKLEGNGISVIAEKIETERQLRELLDFDITYGQGYLFGKPDVQAAYAGKAARAR